MAILEDVRVIVSDSLCLDYSDIQEDSDLVENLGADSLDIVDIILELEDKFNIVIEDEDAEKFKTVSDIVKHIEDNQ